MKRRSFMSAVWVLVGIAMGTNAAAKLAAGDAVGYGFGIIAVGYLGLASYYLVHSEPIEQPDEPAPRRWFELAGLAGVVLIVSFGILAITVGS